MNTLTPNLALKFFPNILSTHYFSQPLPLPLHTLTLPWSFLQCQVINPTHPTLFWIRAWTRLFITQQKHLHNTNIALKFRQLTYSVSTSESSSPSVNIASARAHRVFKRNHPDTTPQTLISRPRSSRLSSHHSQHTNTLFKPHLPSSLQYTYYSTNNTNQLNLFVDENVLVPTLSYNFTNPLKLLLKKNPQDNELCHSFIH